MVVINPVPESFLMALEHAEKLHKALGCVLMDVRTYEVTDANLLYPECRRNFIEGMKKMVDFLPQVLNIKQEMQARIAYAEKKVSEVEKEETDKMNLSAASGKKEEGYG